MWYAIRVYDDDGKPLATRYEKANGPREACKKAFGVIYDRDSDTARYAVLNGRTPKYNPRWLMNQMMADDRWEKIPRTGN